MSSLVTQATFLLAPRITIPLAGLTPAGLPAAFTVGPVLTWAAGTGSGQADLCHASQRTLDPSTSEDLNLFDGSLPALPSGTFAALKIKVVYIHPLLANPHPILVGGASSNAWVGPFGASTHTLTYEPNAPLFFPHPTTGWTVSNTVKLLKVANGGAVSPVIYDLVLIGSSV